MSVRDNIVVLGGGTGSFTLLTALKNLTSHITAIVTMADDGGSSGVLRDELGVLPPGDVRQCLVALSDAPEMRDIFNYRFSEGSLKGHSFGNIFLTALEKMTGSFADAVETASKVLNVNGTVVPITLDDVRLVMDQGDGRTISGEHAIDAAQFSHTCRRPHLSLTPQARINPDAVAAIKAADVVVIAPGDLYTSLGPLLIVDGVRQALVETGAKVVYVCNLTVKPGQTDGLSVAAHAAEIERFAGAPILDYVLFNTAQPEPSLLRSYVRRRASLVAFAENDFRGKHYRAIGLALIAQQPVIRHEADILAATRSYIRHDAEVVAQFVRSVLDALPAL